MTFITGDILAEGNISGSSFYSGSTNLSTILDSINDKVITGGSFNNLTDTITFTNNTGGTFVVTGITDNYTTGTTRYDDILYFDRNDGLSAYTANVGLSDLNYRRLSNNSSTGLLSGGVITTASTTGFTVSAGNGIIVDNSTDPNNPIITEVSWSGFTDVPVLNLTSTTFSNVYINSSGNIVQSNLITSPPDIRDKIHLGAVISVGDAITSVYPSVVQIINPVSQLNDFASAIGKFSIHGNVIQKITGTLKLFKTLGTSFDLGVNYQFDRTNANQINCPQLSGESMHYATQVGFLPKSDSISTTEYDNGGVVTNLPNNKFTTHRIWLKPDNNQLIFQYGQYVYDTFTQAKTSISGEDYISTPFLSEFAFVIALIIVKKGITNLDNPLITSEIIIQQKFTGSGSGGGASTPSLQNVYDVSLSPDIVTDATRGAVSFENGAGPDTGKVFEIRSSTDTTTSFITGDGTISAATIYAPTISATTYLNLPTDIRVTGGTYSNGTAIFTNNTGGTFNVTGITDVYTTGGTTDNLNRTYTFTNNTGGTFTITGLTDVTITGGTLSTGGTATFTNNTGGTFNINGFVQTGRTININGVVQDLSTNRTWRAAMSNTGVLTYSGITTASTTSINISAVSGIISDNETTPNTPSFTLIQYTGETNKPVTTISGGQSTYVILNKGVVTNGIGAGEIVFQNTPPTSAQRKNGIYLSRVSHASLSAITFAVNETDFVLSPLQQYRDMFQLIHFMNQGVVPSGLAGLQLAVSNGRIIGSGINFVADNTTPNTVNVPATSPVSFLVSNQSGPAGSATTTVDVGNYDVGGVTTPVPGGGANATIQYMTYSPNVGFSIQRGQTVYTSLANAVAAVGRETYVVRPNLANNDILIAAICVRKSTVNMNDPAFVTILPANKFGDIGGASAGISVTSLQTAYNNSVVPQITTSTAGGALTLREGGTANTVTVLAVQDLVGTTRFAVDGNGNALISSGLTISPNIKFQVNGVVSASTGNARGTFLNTNLIATANNDNLTELAINPGFTLGAFTGTTQLALSVTGNSRFIGTISASTISATTYQGVLSTQLTTGYTISPVGSVSALTSTDTILTGFQDLERLVKNFDIQSVTATTSATTTSTTNVDMTGMSAVTKNLGSIGTYYINFNANVQNDTINRYIGATIFIGGVGVSSTTATVVSSDNSANRYTKLVCQCVAPIPSGTTIQVRWLTESNTAAVFQRSLTVMGMPSNYII